jgi:hypothetical protein
MELLRLQRTDGSADTYAQDIETAYEQIKPFLPAEATDILDIGSGMAGISAKLYRHYDRQRTKPWAYGPRLYLADRDIVTPKDKLRYGYTDAGQDASAYNSFPLALKLLENNYVDLEQVTCVDTEKTEIPSKRFDVVISLLAWGFHFSIDSYWPQVRPGGVLICDMRKSQGSLTKLLEMYPTAVLAENFSYKKFNRMVVQC